MLAIWHQQQVDLWPWKWCPSHVGYLYANFSLPRPPCSRVSPRYARDVRQKHHLMPPPYGGGGIIILLFIHVNWCYVVCLFCFFYCTTCLLCYYFGINYSIDMSICMFVDPCLARWVCCLFCMANKRSYKSQYEFTHHSVVLKGRSLVETRTYL